MNIQPEFKLLVMWLWQIYHVTTEGLKM